MKKISIIGFIVFLAMPLMSQHVGQDKVYYGAAYYPEAWNFETVEQDIEYMKEANMNVVRVAEFAWSIMEPREGEFQFDWLHGLIEVLHENGIDVVLGTPTATPPAWLGEKYPEIYRVNEDGTQQTHGARKNYNYSCDTYRVKCRVIVDKMAREFGQKPGVIAWQTDNEFSVHYDFSDETRAKWHAWLKKEYETIDKLNEKWCTVLWSQSYNHFGQVPMPVSYVWHHPSLRMAWYRFTNEEIDSFQLEQIHAIKKHSGLPVTHDGMPGQTINYEMLFDDLDFMAVNNYHSFEAYDRIQSNYDRMRGYHMGYHWLFENAPNYSGGGRKGQTWFVHQPVGGMQAAIWMNYALGGQGAMFWLFRQHWAGQEMPHGSIISSWGKPAANFDALKELGNNLKSNSDFLMENPVAPAKAAIFWSHENLQGFRIEEYANGIHYYNDWTYRFYRPLADQFIHRDVLGPAQEIQSYQLLFAPMMPYIPNGLRKELRAWVEKGGILVLGPMSGYRTREWTSFKDHAMGALEDWIGIHVDTRIPIGASRREAEVPFMLEFASNLEIPDAEASLWSEALSTEKGTVLATYKTGMHSGEPAIIENKVGEGMVVVLGTDPGEVAYGKLASHYAGELGIQPMASGDKGIVVSPRGGEGQVIINLYNKKSSLELSREIKRDQLTGKKINSRKIQLQPYQVIVSYGE